MASPVIGDTPAPTERLDCAKAMAGRFDDAEAVQGEVVVHLRKYHFDSLADGDAVAGPDADEL
jgi:hypothetical protein